MRLAGRLRDPAFGNVWHLGFVRRGRWCGAPVRIQPWVWALCAVRNAAVLLCSSCLLGLLLQSELRGYFRRCAWNLGQRRHIGVETCLGQGLPTCGDVENG